MSLLVRLLLGCALALAGCAHPTARPEPALAKRLVLETEGLGTATGFAELGTGDETRLLVVGQLGTRVVGADGALLEQVDFPTDCECLSTPALVVPVDLDEDGVPELLNRGGNWHRVGIFERDGTIRWTYDPESAPNWLTPGDLDGDGQPEFVVGHNGGGGVAALDAAGEILWRMPDDNVWRVELVDADRDGKPEILHTNAAGEFVLRDAEGRVLRRFHSSWFGGQFDVLPGGRVLQHAGREFLFLDPRGEVLSRRPAAVGGTFSDLASLELDLVASEGRELAILESSSRLSVLHVFDAGGRLLHEELLDAGCRGLGARALDDGGEELLVGCRERVFGYRAGGEGVVGLSVRSAAALLEPGDALGPFSLGEPRESVERKLGLLPGECLAEGCRWTRTELDGVPVILGVELEDETLSLVMALSVGASGSALDADRIRAAWGRLVDLAERRFGEPTQREPGFPDLEILGESWATHTWDREGSRVQVGVLLDESDGKRFTPVVYVEPRSGTDPPVPAAAP